MTIASTPCNDASVKAAREPSYEIARRESDVLARFPSGARVPVVRGRERAYPGLRSEAPSTLAYYQAFAPLIVGKHVLDAGCGAGTGARVLRERISHVTALDHDARALAFGREYAPEVEFLPADLQRESPVDRADCAVVIDVLGHLSEPETALRGLRACLPPGSKLFVAEPRAYASQRLLPPVCRAFSGAALRRLLLRTGFELEELTTGGRSFSTAVAHRSQSAALEALSEGFRLSSRAQLPAARDEFLRARQSVQPEVQLEATLGQAEAALAEFDGDTAVRCYFEANALDGRDGRALAGLSHIALLSGENEDALRLAVDAVRRDPTDANANAAMALAAERLDHPDAFNTWRIAANLAPDHLEIATGLARLAAARQNFAFAIRVFERLRGYRSVLGAEFHVSLGWLLLADGRSSDARVEADYANQMAPGHAAVGELLQALAE